MLHNSWVYLSFVAVTDTECVTQNDAASTCTNTQENDDVTELRAVNNTADIPTILTHK